MATFSTWAAFRTSLLDAIQTHVEGEPFTGRVSVTGATTVSVEYNSLAEAMDWYRKSYQLEALDNAGDPALRVSYGRFRRFR